MQLVSSSCAFPLKSSSFAQSATITDKNGSVVAEDFIVKLSNTYAYAVLGEQSSSIKNKTIRVEQENEGCKLKIISIENEREDRRLLPVYVQFHYNPKGRYADSHTIDLLAETFLGRQNLDLKKNITIDFFEVPVHARDESGFVVSDKMQFVYETFNVANLRNQLSAKTDVDVSRYSSNDLEELIDYDNGVSGFNRTQYIQEMVDKTCCLVARIDGSISGFILGREGRIFSLFGDSRSIVHTLLDNFLSTSTSSTVSLYSPIGHWKGSLQSRRVYRYHSRVVPSAIDWSRIYSHNVGMNIV